MGTQLPSPPVREAIARATGRDARSLTIHRRPPLAHQTNHLYDVWVDGQRLIAKEYLGDVERNSPLNEYRALHVVQALDIAPRPVFFDASVGPVVVYEFVDGEMWDCRVPSVAELEMLADVWAELHALPTDGLWVGHGQAQNSPTLSGRLRAPIEHYAAWARNSHRLEAADVCVEALACGLAHGLPLVPELAPLSFCRSDARFANVIARPDGRVGLVDWEDSGLRDPARELADLLHHPNQEDLLDAEGWQPFLNRYLPSRSADAGFGERLRGYVALFPVFWLGILLEDGLRRAETGALQRWLFNELDPNLRLQRYVARGLAWPALDPTRRLSDVAGVTFF